MKSQQNVPLKIGTRGSLLALAQSKIVLEILKDIYPHDPVVQNATLVPITTTGDRLKDRPLSEFGGKGLFSKELEHALRNREIDAAVHSLKDMETSLAQDMLLIAYLKRGDARDAMLSNQASSLSALAPGSIVGTCAPRRIAQILHQRPDLVCVPLRGNVDSRIQKLHEGQMDAIILALVGLHRLNRQNEATYIFPESEMLPAVGQGVLTIECRKEDKYIQDYFAPLNHKDTERAINAERAFLAGLAGNCKTPIGAHAYIQADGRIRLDAMIASLSGSTLYRTMQIGDDPISIGMSCAEFLNGIAGPGFWDNICIS